jgi:hypothetical protein
VIISPFTTIAAFKHCCEQRLEHESGRSLLSMGVAHGPLPAIFGSIVKVICQSLQKPSSVSIIVVRVRGSRASFKHEELATSVRSDGLMNFPTPCETEQAACPVLRSTMPTEWHHRMINAWVAATTCPDLTTQGHGQSVRFGCCGSKRRQWSGVKAGRPITSRKPL